MNHAAELRRQHLGNATTSTVDPDLHRQYHVAIIDFYLRLRPYRHRSAITNLWNEEIVSYGDAVVFGASRARVPEFSVSNDVDGLQAFVVQSMEVEKQQKGPRGGTKQESAAVGLSMDALLRAHSHLDDIAEKLGLAPEPAPDAPTTEV